MTSDEAKSVLVMKEKDLLSMSILKESELTNLISQLDAAQKRISELEVYDSQLQADKRKAEIARVVQTKTEMVFKLRSLGLEKQASAFETIQF